MLRSIFIASSLAASAFAAPTPVADKRQLLTDLSPDVVALLNSLGLSGLSAPVGGIVTTLGQDLKKRQLLTDLSPDVVALLNSLGLSGLSAPVGGIVTTLGEDLKKRQLLNDLSPDVVALLNSLGLSGLSGLSAPVGGIVTTLSEDLKKRQLPGVPDVPGLSEGGLPTGGLLSDLSPSVVALLASLGLVGPAAPVWGVLNTLSGGLKKRQLPGVPEVPGVPDVPGLPEGDLPSGGLLAGLSPSVVALLASLGLVGPAVPVGGVLNTLSTGL